jgi:hypothetical protein
MKEEEKPPHRVVRHEQLSVSERRRLPRGHTELVNVYRVKKSRYTFNVPQWLLPKNGVHIWNTISASIVWGICGQMADMPDYGRGGQS